MTPLTRTARRSGWIFRRLTGLRDSLLRALAAPAF
jgi:hypothetical protein